ncbi:MAG: alpha/beta hydrolase [Solirubrobacteraceae bacterium]|nr:alpha/beta hydrolase [Solirubrobacteraceae bacterium]
MPDPTVSPERHTHRDDTYTERAFGPASHQSRYVFRLLRLFAHPFIVHWRPTRRGIRFLRWLYGTVIQVPAMRGTTIEHRSLGGVPVEWTTTARAAEARHGQRVILYLHGGGYVFGAPRTHRNLASRLSHVTATPVANVDYRMPPQTSLRQGQDDVLAAYLGLIDAGYAGEGILVAGDSAGGGHAARLVLRLIEEGHPGPAGVVLLSPWTDLTASGASLTSNSRFDFVIVKEILDRIARALAPTDENRRDWRNSPAFAPDELLAQFPPTLVQVGSRETLRDDGLAFARRLGDAGATVEAQIYAGQGHVVAMWSGTPDSRRAMQEIFDWLKLVLPDERDPSDPTVAELAEADEAGGNRPLD